MTFLHYDGAILTREHLAIAAGLCVLYYFAHTLYNLFLHPLSRYPGPVLCAISRLPLTRVTINATQIYWINSLHEKYGHVVRVAPDQLSFTDERAWSDIGGSTAAAKFGMPKDERLNHLVGGDTINPNPNLSKAEQKHTQMRKAFAPGLTKAALRQQYHLIQGHVQELVDEVRLRGSSGQEPVDMVEMGNFVAYNIFSELLLGETFNMFKDPTYAPWVRSIKGFARATISMAALQHFFFPRHIMAFVIRHFGSKPRDAFMNVCFDLFDRRAASTTDHPDLFHFATMETKSGGPQLPLKDMRSFVPFLMLAGGETTPTLISGMLFYLLNNPQKLAHLVSEVRHAFEGVDEISVENLFQLPYLSACIEESLRLYPPIAAGIERVVPPGGAPIAGEVIPGGTIVLVAQYATHHQSRNFARPNDWVPERWLPESESNAEFGKDHKAASKPFSVGPHSCFGQDLAQFVIRLTVCKLLLHYDVTLSPDSKHWMVGQPVYFGWIKPELYIYFKPVKC